MVVALGGVPKDEAAKRPQVIKVEMGDRKDITRYQMGDTDGIPLAADELSDVDGFPALLGAGPGEIDEMPIWVLTRDQQQSIESARDGASDLRSTDAELTPISTISFTTAGSYAFVVPGGTKAQIFAIRLLVSGSWQSSEGGLFRYYITGVLPGMSIAPAAPTRTPPVGLLFGGGGPSQQGPIVRTYMHTLMSRVTDGAPRVYNPRAENAQDVVNPIVSPTLVVTNMPAGWSVQGQVIMANVTQNRAYNVMLQGWLDKSPGICSRLRNYNTNLILGSLNLG
jgi:hypothetical protein